MSQCALKSLIDVSIKTPHRSIEVTYVQNSDQIHDQGLHLVLTAI